MDNNSIIKNRYYCDFEKKLCKLMDFLDSLSTLMYESGQTITCITHNKTHFFQPLLINSSVKTLKSIKYCCMFESFGDANLLVRKFRDDLMLYLYILEVLNNRKLLSIDQEEEFLKGGINVDNILKATKAGLKNMVSGCMKSDDDISVDAWFDNNVNKLSNLQKKKLSIQNYINYLETNDTINKLLHEYDLKKHWENIRRKLNDYTHNNGQHYTTENIMVSSNKDLEKCYEEIIARLNFVTALFLMLLILIKPSMIQATDYIEYLDCGLTPPEGSQYNVAPFIQEFINEYINRIHPELKAFLKYNNKYGMLIE